MHLETTSISERPDLSSSAHIHWYRVPLLRLLREAQNRAIQTGRHILATFLLPAADIDPLHVYAALEGIGQSPRFYWERPAEQAELVGGGAAMLIEASGAANFTTVSNAWSEIMQDAVTGGADETIRDDENGPIGFAGFAFDPLAPRTPLWAGFPDGLLILPRLSLRKQANNTMLALNRLIAASDDIDQCADDMLRDLIHLAVVHAHLTEPPTKAKADGDTSFYTEELCPASVWKEIVANAVDDIRHGNYKKVMLARAIRISRTEGAFDINAALQRLRESYPTAHVFALQRGERVFMGATPEPLAYTRDGQLQTMSLAGTAPRGETGDDDQRLGQELLNSAKNRQEHAIVVETMRDALSGLCAELEIAPEPRLLRLKNVQHLETPIRGQLLPELSILDVVACLHPTPAVGGFPLQTALEKIRRNEQMDRGWYAGPVGWIDAHGNGEFAVALRSALVQGNEATLFAGNGMVADSEPESEYAETCFKLQVMLHSLDGDEG
jgi:isochorismate synthase